MIYNDLLNGQFSDKLEFSEETADGSKVVRWIVERNELLVGSNSVASVTYPATGHDEELGIKERTCHGLFAI